MPTESAFSAISLAPERMRPEEGRSFHLPHEVIRSEDVV